MNKLQLDQFIFSVIKKHTDKHPENMEETSAEWEEYKVLIEKDADFKAVHQSIKEVAQTLADTAFDNGVEAAIESLGLSSKGYHYPADFIEMANWMRGAKKFKPKLGEESPPVAPGPK